MAFTKEQKSKIVEQYKKWLSQSQAVFIIEFSKMTMKDIDAFRAKLREAGAEVHVAKNTLLTLALDEGGYQIPKKFEKTTLVCFAVKDVAAIAKAVSESTNKSEVFKLKGGFLGKRAIGDVDIKALAELPPLPVMRARVMGVILAPASQVARTLAEPGRSVASVFRAYSEKEAVPTAA